MTAQAARQLDPSTSVSTNPGRNYEVVGERRQPVSFGKGGKPRRCSHEADSHRNDRRLALGLWALPSTAIAQQALVVKALSEKKVTELPSGPLFWRLENFPTLVQAQAAAGHTGLAVESGGKVWLFKLGPRGWVISGRHQGCRGWTTPFGLTKSLALPAA
jgi:hypothetical protein